LLAEQGFFIGTPKGLSRTPLGLTYA